MQNNARRTATTGRPAGIGHKSGQPVTSRRDCSKYNKEHKMTPGKINWAIAAVATIISLIASVGLSPVLPIEARHIAGGVLAGNLFILITNLAIAIVISKDK